MVTIADFKFRRVGFGIFVVEYLSDDGHSYKFKTTDGELIDRTFGLDDPSMDDLLTLKDMCEYSNY